MIDEVIIKEVSFPRLTLTSERMTIKFSENFVDKERIIEFSNKIKELIQSKIEHTIRGRFKLVNEEYTIDLEEEQKDSKNYKFWETEI